MQTSLRSNLKKHIQALRGISVLIVFFYHLNIEIFSYGYFGVDIFFVISGYVISNKLYDDYKVSKKINIINFWQKRFFRIYPVLVFIFSASFLLYLTVGQLYLLRGIFDQFISSLFGFSNFYFLYHGVDYFNDLSSSPFLHSWSLGIEEQFYLIYPLILSLILFLYTKNKNYILNIIIFLFFLLSLVSVFLLELKDPKFVFYFPLLRFWELSFGCLIYFLKFNEKNFCKKNFTSILIILIFITFTLFHLEIQNLFKTILVVLLASYCLKFYSKDVYISSIFENKYLIFLGNISFSIYLWHLPIIYFLNLYFGHHNIILPALLITFILSIITYTNIEEKFRHSRFSLSSFFKLITIIFIILGSILILNSHDLHVKEKLKKKIYKVNYLEKRNYSSRVNFYNIELNKNKIYDYCVEDPLKNFNYNIFGMRAECSKLKDNKKLFFFIGNSHTANFITAANYSKNILNLYYLHYSSPFEIKNISFIDKQLKNFDEVILVTSISSLKNFYDFNIFYKKLDKKIKILLIGPIPNVTQFDPLLCIVRNYDCHINADIDYKERNLKNLEDKIMNLTYENQNIKYFNPYLYFCRTNQKMNKCYIYEKEKDFLTHRDGSHLTIEGSLFLKDELNKFIKKNY